MLRTASSAFLLGACLALVAVMPGLSVAPGEGAWMYGLRRTGDNDDDPTPYAIFQLNPLLQEQEIVKETTFMNANAMAFDTARDQLLFLVDEPVSEEGCWVFDIKTQMLTKVTTLAAMGYGSPPSNAAYYDGAWVKRSDRFVSTMP